MVKEDEEYFSHENEVFTTFITKINEALLTHKRVFADATHLNLSSRAKVLTRLITEPDIIDSINVIWLKTPLIEIYSRNDLRTGREKVPHNVIKSMYDSIQEPSIKEGISQVYIVDGFTHELKVLSLGQKNKENFIY